jgi:hypothetical protein
VRKAGVAPEVIRPYLDVDESSPDGLHRIVEPKLAAARDRGDHDSATCAQGAAQHRENSVLHH